MVNKIEELFSVIDEKQKILKKLKNITNDLVLKANNINMSDLNECNYEECNDLFKQIRGYIQDQKLLDKIDKVIEKKKIKKYPQLLKPTYYPEIDLLNISESEKLRLDKAARNNIGNYINEYFTDIKHPLSIEDLKMLKDIGVIEKIYRFKCKECGGFCRDISEKSLNNYKRFWTLYELEKNKQITDEQLKELDRLDEKGFYGIYFSCINCDECVDIEIADEEQLSDYIKNNVEVFYKVIKKPDLTYENL